MVNLKSKDESGKGVLHAAVFSGDLKIVKYLAAFKEVDLEQKFVSTESNFSYSPLDLAIGKFCVDREKFSPIVNFFLESGVNVETALEVLEKRVKVFSSTQLKVAYSSILWNMYFARLLDLDKFDSDFIFKCITRKVQKNCSLLVSLVFKRPLALLDMSKEQDLLSYFNLCVALFEKSRGNKFFKKALEEVFYFRKNDSFCDIMVRFARENLLKKEKYNKFIRFVKNIDIQYKIYEKKAQGVYLDLVVVCQK